jgi:polysaccharide biosynthesis protein VpsQ
MKWVTLLFTAFVILIILLADTGNLGILALMNSFPHADKLGHFILYGILALLINLTLFRGRPPRSRKWLAFGSSLILAVFIGLEELSQQYFSNRTFSIADLVAGYLGVLFFAWLSVIAQK